MDIYVVFVRSGNLVQTLACSTEEKAWQQACSMALNLIRHGYFPSGVEGHAARMEIEAAVKAGDNQRVVNFYVSFARPNHYIGVQRCTVDSV